MRQNEREGVTIKDDILEGKRGNKRRRAKKRRNETKQAEHRRDKKKPDEMVRQIEMRGEKK